LTTPYGPYGDLLASLIEKQAALETLRQAAARDLKELLALTSEARLRRVNRAHSRFRNPILVDLLTEESRRCVTAVPKAALSLAECASAIALRVDYSTVGRAWAATALARSSACRGNALRATGDLKAAEQPLRFARQVLETDGNGDPLVAAEIASLTASLRFDQRRFHEAEALLADAFTTYESLGQIKEAASILISQGLLFAEQGKSKKAIRVTLAAAQSLDPERDARLYLATQFNLALFLEDFGEYERALRLLEEQRPLFERFQDPWTMLRYRWSLGTIRRGLGKLEEAEVALAGVRDAFLDVGHSYDAALVGLDLALVHLHRSNLTALRLLTDEIVPVFLQESLEREVIGALLLFRRAVDDEQATASMVSGLIRTVRSARKQAAGRPS
jgi:tetratricopeptide (TPR) repeat protein